MHKKVFFCLLPSPFIQYGQYKTVELKRQHPKIVKLRVRPIHFWKYISHLVVQYMSHLEIHSHLVVEILLRKGWGEGGRFLKRIFIGLGKWKLRRSRLRRKLLRCKPMHMREKTRLWSSYK